MKRGAPAAFMIITLVVGCGGEASEQAKTPEPAAEAASNFDPCALLTAEEIQATVGWTPDSAVKKSYGSTGNCSYFGPKAGEQLISLIVAAGMPDMSSARVMADWRAKQYVDYGVKDATVEPIDDLGVPAIRNEFGVIGVEMAVGSQLVSVSSFSASFEQVKALAARVLARAK